MGFFVIVLQFSSVILETVSKQSYKTDKETEGKRPLEERDVSTAGDQVPCRREMKRHGNHSGRDAEALWVPPTSRGLRRRKGCEGHRWAVGAEMKGSRMRH